MNYSKLLKIDNIQLTLLYIEKKIDPFFIHLIKLSFPF